MQQANTIPKNDRTRIRALISARGESAVARDLGLSRQSLARAIAGLEVRRGTAALIRERLREIAADASTASASAT